MTDQPEEQQSADERAAELYPTRTPNVRERAQELGLSDRPFGSPKPFPRVKVAPDAPEVELSGSLPSYQDPAAPRPDVPPQELPNYDKLSRFERFVMDRLPGFAESGVGQALERFNESWMGKALMYVDVGAEALERGVGFVVQWNEARKNNNLDEFNAQLGEAWYAGALTADVTNLPGITPEGRVKYPQDLPGTGYLAEARQELYNRAQDGEDPGEVLIDIRNRMYEEHGALALRMQLNDAMFHVVADPLNYILPALAPVDALHARRASIISGVARKFAHPEEYARILDGARDALRVAEEAGDVGAIERVAAHVNNMEAFTEVGPLEQIVIKLTGGLPGAEPGSRLNPFALTREAKAYEFVNMIQDNVQARVIGASDDPHEWLRAMERALDGTGDPALSAMLLTPEGRMARGELQAMTAKLRSLTEAYDATEYERQLLQLSANIIDEHPGELFRLLDEGDEAQAIIRQINNALDEGSAEQLANLLRLHGRNVEQLTDDILGIPKVFGKTDELSGLGIYTDELLQTEAMIQMGDVASQMAVARYGIEARGLLQKVSHMVKSAETLAFLRANPAYPIKNFLNNEFTMIARGAYGTFSLDDAAELWKRLGFEPPRLRSGFGPAEIEAAVEAGEVGAGSALAMEKASQAIQAAANPNPGWTDRVTRFFNGIEVPVRDMGQWAAQIESRSSVRATTAGYLQGWRKFWQPPTVAEYSDDVASILPDDVQKALQRAVRSGMTPDEIDAKVFAADNIALNADNVLERASRALGEDIDLLLDAEFQAKHMDDLLAAAERGPKALREEIVRVKGEAHRYIDELTDEALEVIRQETYEQVTAEKPGAFGRLWGDTVDSFWAAHSGEAKNLARLTRAAREADGDAAGVLWRAIDASQDRYWNRTWSQFEARMSGFSDAAKDLGLPNADMIQDSFKAWRKDWDGYFKERNFLYDEYFEARRLGEEPRLHWDTIQGRLKNRYSSLAKREDTHLAEVDRAMASFYPEEQRPLFQAWRDAVKQWRRKDRQLVQEFRESVDDIPADELGDAWNAHWQERQGLWKRIVAEERNGLRALQGDDAAASRYNVPQMQADQQAVRSWVAGERPRDLEIPEGATFFDPDAGKRVSAEGYPADFYWEQRKTEIIHEYGREHGMGQEIDRLDQLTKSEIPTTEKMREQASGILNRVDEALPAQADGAETTPVSEAIRRYDETQELPESMSNHGEWLWTNLDAEQKGALLSEVGNEQAAKKFLDDLTTGPMSEQARTALVQEREALRQNVLSQLDANWRGSRYFFEVDPKDPGMIHVHGPDIKDVRFFKPTPDRPAIFQLRHMSRRGQGSGERVFLEQLDWLKQRGETKVWSSAQTDEGVGFWNAMAEKGYVNRTKGVRDPETGVGYIEYEIGDFTKPVPDFDEAALPDFHQLVPQELKLGTGLSEMWFNKADEAVDVIGDEALKIAQDERKIRFGDLNEAQQSAARQYVQGMKGQMSDARYAATRFAMYKRDSALLNYNRRLNYNTWLGTLAPYEFWMTNTAFRWALHNMDRPAMFSTYLRMQKFLRTAMRPESGLPARLQGSIRVPIPFKPDWMGDDMFVDPFGSALPFNQLAYGVEQFRQQSSRDEDMALRTLEELLNDGQISEPQYRQAVENQEGPVWDRAVELARLDDREGRKNAFDFMSMLATPHAPLMWAYHVSQGRSEDISPFLPLTRTVKGLSALLGVKPGGVNIEGGLRRTLGLPEFDKWDDYRIDRMLANMAADGEISADMARRAMIERGQSEDPAVRAQFREAERRAGIEFGWGVMGSTLGMPSRPYPTGEEHLRELRNDYEYAWERYERGDKQALSQFYEDHPEYEARLALFQEPEERLRRFLIDETWDRWNELPSLSKREITDQLGPDFEQAFLDRDTRNTDAITTEDLSVWLMLMGGDPPGTLPKATPLNLAPPEVAQRAEVFYELRRREFPNYFDLQDDYFKLAKGPARRRFLRENPELKSYWDWRRDFLKRNPRVAPHIDEDFEPNYTSQEQLEEVEAEEPSFTLEEWQVVLDPATYRVMVDMTQGRQLPDELSDEIADIASQLGMTPEEMVEDFHQAAGQ